MMDIQMERNMKNKLRLQGLPLLRTASYGDDQGDCSSTGGFRVPPGWIRV